MEYLGLLLDLAGDAAEGAADRAAQDAEGNKIPIAMTAKTTAYSAIVWPPSCASRVCNFA
jgi:hypothetical protein